MSHALVAVEGVLCPPVRPGQALTTALPVARGLEFAASLRSVYTVSFSTVSADREGVVRWLMLQGWTDHEYSRLFSREHLDAGMDDGELQEAHLRRLKATQADVALYVTPDPQVAARSMYHGVNTVLWCSPAYARPEWRPDAPPDRRAWDAIEAEAERQRLLSVTDPRRNDDA